MLQIYLLHDGGASSFLNEILKTVWTLYPLSIHMDTVANIVSQNYEFICNVLPPGGHFGHMQWKNMSFRCLYKGYVLEAADWT